MVEISLSGSGEGRGWATAPGYSTAACAPDVRVRALCQTPTGSPRRGYGSSLTRSVLGGATGLNVRR